MSIVFDYIVKLYNKSKQIDENNKGKMNYNPLFKSRYFIQLILYTFDEAYYAETYAKQLTKIRKGELADTRNIPANSEEDKYSSLFDCFPYLSEQRMETFIKIFREIRMDKIIDKYTTEHYDLSFLIEDGVNVDGVCNPNANIRTRLLERLPFNKLYPDVFFEFLDDHKYEPFSFGLATKRTPMLIDFVHTWDTFEDNTCCCSACCDAAACVGCCAADCAGATYTGCCVGSGAACAGTCDPIPRTDTVKTTNYIDMRNDNFVASELNEFIDRANDRLIVSIGKRLDMILSNMVYVPRKIKGSSQLITLIANNYKPIYNAFLIDYIRKNKNIMITSIDQQSSVLISIIMNILKYDKVK